MVLKKKLFSYDSVEDADIVELFRNLPAKQHSKYMRIALRLLIEQCNHENPEQWQLPYRGGQQSYHQRAKTANDDNYHDGISQIQDLGR